MSKHSVALGRWIRICLGRGDGKIVLRNADSDVAKGVPVDSWTISDMSEEGGGLVDSASIGNLADGIIARAQDDADGIGGPQRYVTMSYSAENEKATSRFPFKLRGEGNGEDGDDDSAAGADSPNMRGLLTQLMRHNEASNRALTGGIAMTVRALEGTIARQAGQIEVMMESHWRNIQAREESLSLQSERDLALLKAGNDEDRKTKIYSKVEQLAPAVLNMLAGKTVIPGADPLSISLVALAESMTEEQFMAIMKHLNPEQQINLLSAIKSAKSKSGNGTT